MATRVRALTVLVCGPESSGKSTLARQLAWALDGEYVAEQARAWLTARNGHYTRADLDTLLDLQLEAERTARARSASFVFCDTGPLNFQLWSQVRFRTTSDAINRAVSTMNYDVVVLCAPDLPWRADPLRESPDAGERQALFDAYHRAFTAHPRFYVVRGNDRAAGVLNWLLPSPDQIPVA